MTTILHSIWRHQWCQIRISCHHISAIRRQCTTGNIIWPFWRFTTNSIHITCCKDKPLINRKISALILKIGQ